MGIDLKDSGRTRKTGRRHLVSKNPYSQLLVNLYKFLSRRTNSNFNKVVLKRLIMPKRFRPQLSLSKLSRLAKHKSDIVLAVVGSVTNDLRLLNVPRMSVCALRFSEVARARILKSGGECLTFDQLALRHPEGDRCILLRGKTKSREAEKHFGSPPGVPHSSAKPYVRSKGRKFEKGRGRRKSRGFKV